MEPLEPGNAISLLEPYDIILDCTDNAPTRYLISDTAVHLNKPLVSGAAQKFDGQLCVYNLGPDGPCYRCLFSRPPAPEVSGSCEDVGVLGVVTGIIGNLQALETIKILTGLHGVSYRSLFGFVITQCHFLATRYLQTENPRFSSSLHCRHLNSETSSFDHVAPHALHAETKARR